MIWYEHLLLDCSFVCGVCAKWQVSRPSLKHKSHRDLTIFFEGA